MEHIRKVQAIDWSTDRQPYGRGDDKGNAVISVYMRVVSKSVGSRHLVRLFSPFEWNHFVSVNGLSDEYLVHCD